MSPASRQVATTEDPTPGPIPVVRVEGGRKGSRWVFTIPTVLITAGLSGLGTWFFAPRGSAAEPSDSQAHQAIGQRIGSVEKRVDGLEAAHASLLDAGQKRETRLSVQEAQWANVREQLARLELLTRELLAEMRRRP